MKHLAAAANPALRRVAGLMESAAARREARRLVLEGAHLLESCVRGIGSDAVESMLLREDTPDPVAQWALRLAPQAQVLSVGVRAFERLSPVAGDNGMLAVVHLPAPSEPAHGGLELWLDEVQDPGNAGSIVRTAAAAGATRVVFGHGSADAWSPKCLRGGMGGHFLCSIVPEDDLRARARDYPGRVMAAAASGGTDLYAADLTGDVAILLGAEGRGLSAELQAIATQRVWIPVAEGTESLNVGAAAAVLCFERVRQLRERRAAGG
jgi:TrmH family RNA methyltransferase